MNQPNSSGHVWYYLRSGLFQQETEGPFDERAIVELAEAGKIKLRTKLRSPTRTKNSLIYAEDVPALVAAIERAKGAAAAASKEEKKRQAAEAKSEASKKRVESEREQVASAPLIQTRSQLVNRATAPSAQGVGIQIPTGMHPQRVLLLAASLVALGGVVLPWIHVPMAGGISGFGGGSGDGWFVVACFLPPLGISVAPNLSMPLGLVRRIVAAVFATLGGLVAGLEIWHLHGTFMVSEVDPDDAFGFGKALASATVWGPGLFIIIAMAVACVVISAVFPLPSKKTLDPS